MLRTWPVRLPAIEFTLSVRSFQVPADALAPGPGRRACPRCRPRAPRGSLREANELSWSTIVLMVFFSSRISPFTSTVIFLDRSPLATAVVTSAMLRTWPVRLAAIEFTLSVRSFQVPATPSHLRLAAELAFGADLARHAGHFARRSELSWSTIVLMVFFSSRISPLHVDGDLLRQVAVGDRGGHLGDVAHLAGQVAGHRVHVVGEVLPGAGDALHLRLAAELAFGADLARHAGHLRGEGVELVDHRVDGVLQLQDLAAARRR